MPAFTSLQKALEDSFDLPLADLPVALRERVADVFGNGRPHWDCLTPDQRQRVAEAYDIGHDPELQAENERLFDLFARIEDRKRSIRETKMLPIRSPGGKEKARRLIAEDEEEIARLEAELPSQDVPQVQIAAGIRGLAEADAPLVDEMERIIASERISDTAAAKRVVSRATGGGGEDARIRRLVGRLKQRRLHSSP